MAPPAHAPAHAAAATTMLDPVPADQLTVDLFGEPSEPQQATAPSSPVEEPAPAFDEEALEALKSQLSSIEASIDSLFKRLDETGEDDGSEAFKSLETSVEGLSKRFDEKISRSEHEVTVMKNMSDEMQGYREGLYAKLTLPLVRDMVEAHGALVAAIARYDESGDGARLASEVALCRDSLSDALARNSVEIVSSNEGDEFESFKHKVVGKVHTDDESQQGRIAEVIGQSYKLDGQFVAPALVKLYTTEGAGE